MPTLETPTALPKSTSGRRAKPLDEAFAKALVAAMSKTPVVDGRPALHGSSDRFTTRGRANSDGRRYANHVQDSLKIDKVSVKVDEYGKDSFGWKLYIPMSVQGETA